MTDDSAPASGRLGEACGLMRWRNNDDGDYRVNWCSGLSHQTLPGYEDTSPSCNLDVITDPCSGILVSRPIYRLPA